MNNVLSNKTTAQNFLLEVASGKVDEAFEKYISPKFIHHNAYFKGDLESLKTAMKENATLNPQKQITILRVLGEENMVATHSHIKQNPTDLGAVVVHIFRFENEKIIELWDVGTGVPKEIINDYGIF